MQDEQIIDYISDPSLLLFKPDIELLKGIKDKYPYFQSIHLLLAIAVNQTESVFSNKNLREAAIYAGSRSRMHYFYTPDFSQKGKDVVGAIKQRSKSPEKRIRKKSDDTIDRFIKTKPSVQRSKADFYDPVEKASKSIEEDESFVTETLAKIYSMQGRYSKAIKIYQKLSLINPEKSDYFALLIKHLEDKINE